MLAGVPKSAHLAPLRGAVSPGCGDRRRREWRQTSGRPGRGRHRERRNRRGFVDNLIARGIDPAVPRLFIIGGAKALSKAVRRTFGQAAAVWRCTVIR
jgi:hypothetical protein